MPSVSENIPESLAARVDAALRWHNASVGTTFEVTGIVDSESALAGSDELKLILCGGGVCEQRSFRVRGEPGAWNIESINPVASPDPLAAPQAELDPPPGARRDWINETLPRHAFVVLLFYRGFW